MKRLDTRLEGPMLIEPVVHGDERGFFTETYRRSTFMQLGIEEEMVQDNHSRSGHGIVRGMHFQIGRGAAKLVRCGRGAIYDVIVDIRRRSPTFGEWEGFELSDENMRSLYVPVGFAHGFAVLSDVADVLYKQSAEWSPHADRGFTPEDPEVGIDWPVDRADRVLSERDRNAPRLADLEALLSPG